MAKRKPKRKGLDPAEVMSAFVAGFDQLINEYASMNRWVLAMQRLAQKGGRYRNLLADVEAEVGKEAVPKAGPT